MTRDISDRIKFVGFIMTIFIVIYHCQYHFDSVNVIDERINTTVISFAESLAYIALCWFFSTSGFLLFRTLSMKNYTEKVKKRAFTLLLPFAIWEAVTVALNTVILLLAHKSPDPLQILRKMLDVIILRDWPSDTALWYIYVLFFWTLLSPILLLVFSNKKVGWCATVAVTFAIYIFSATENVLFEKITSYGYMWSILTYFPAFMIGAFMGRFSEGSDGTDKMKYVLSLIILALALEIGFPGITAKTIAKILPTLLLYFTPMIPAVRDRKIYHLSFMIYAIHKPMSIIKDYMLKFFFKISPYTSVANIAVRIIFPIFIVALATVAYKVIQRISPKLLRAVTGGRV